MPVFKKIETEKTCANSVFRLELPSPYGAPVTLIVGKQNYLIDCGNSDVAVTKYIIPALKAKKLSLNKIDYLLFTHCHYENIGGAYKIKQLAPNIRIIAIGNQLDKLRNPTHYLTKRWEELPDWAPPLKELRGVVADNVNSKNEPKFDAVTAIPTPGHSSDCVSWSVKDCDIIVCGSALQGNGSAETGIAYYVNLSDYLNSLDKLEKLSPSILLCNTGMKALDGVISGKEKCINAINFCYEETEKYKRFLKEYSATHGAITKNADYLALVNEFFQDAEKPSCLGYAMTTFKAHNIKKD